MIKTLIDIPWLIIGKTKRYNSLKKDISHVCRDVTRAACIDEICIHDIVKTFHNHGYSIIKTHKKTKTIVPLLDESMKDHIKEMIADKRKVGACKYVRNVLNIGLKEALNKVNEIEQEMKKGG